MKTILHYSEKMTLCVRALGITATIDLGCKSLDDTLGYVDCIFGDATMFHGEDVEYVHVINSETGELIAECVPDHEDPNEDDYDPDWGYNEDMGFDPYMGCYSDDC